MSNHKRLEITEILDLTATDDPAITLRKVIDRVAASYHKGLKVMVVELPTEVSTITHYDEESGYIVIRCSDALRPDRAKDLVLHDLLYVANSSKY